jgi:hypothetical protein
MKRTTLLATAGGAVAAVAATLAIAVPALAQPIPTPAPPSRSAPAPEGTAPGEADPCDGERPGRGEGGGRGGDGPGARPAGEPVTVESTVASTTTGPDGELDGLVLADGTEVRVGPRRGVDLAAYPVGTPLRVEGERDTSPDGSAHLHPTTITDTATGESVTVQGRR